MACKSKLAMQETGDRPFDVLDWTPQYLSCQRYFIDHAQLSCPVQAIAAYVNIHLPFQRPPIPSRAPLDCPPPVPGRSHPTIFHASSPVSLIPYLRRLVVTGMDSPGVLHGFFGDDWASGVGPIHKQERRNYLFSAKSEGWIATKRDYDMLPLETVPFMRPLQGSATTEIEGAENTWSEWLAMGDWMVGPRAPDYNLENTQEKGGRSEMLGGV